MTKRNHSDYSLMLRLLSVKKSVGYLSRVAEVCSMCLAAFYWVYILHVPVWHLWTVFPTSKCYSGLLISFFSGIIFWLSNSWHISQSVIVSRWLPYLAFENLSSKKLVTPYCNISKVHLTHYFLWFLRPLSFLGPGDFLMRSQTFSRKRLPWLNPRVKEM